MIESQSLRLGRLVGRPRATPAAAMLIATDMPPSLGKIESGEESIRGSEAGPCREGDNRCTG